LRAALLAPGAEDEPFKGSLELRAVFLAPAADAVCAPAASMRRDGQMTIAASASPLNRVGD